MQFKQLTIILLFLMSTNYLYAQKKFKVVVTETGSWQEMYSLVDENGKLIRRLDTAKYLVCFNPDQYVYFAIFGVKGSTGWEAINSDEKLLFHVYNTSFGEPSPDYFVENKIRITDKNAHIGFADHTGKVIIKPQFEIATSFYNGKAIIGRTCKKVPWGEHKNEGDCEHYSVTCQEHGYINEKGTTLKLGKSSFEEIVKEIAWKSPEE